MFVYADYLDNLMIMESIELEGKRLQRYFDSICNNEELITENFVNSIKSGINGDKLKNGVNKLLGLARKIYDYLKNLPINSIKSSQEFIRNKNIEITQKMISGGDPFKTKKAIISGLDGVEAALNSVESMLNNPSKVQKYIGLLSIPIPLPGSTTFSLALADIPDLLLDYQRRYTGKDFTAIERICQIYTDKASQLEASDQYNMDKLLSRITGVLNDLMTEVKRLFVCLQKYTYKAADKINDKIDIGDKDKRGRAIKSIIDDNKKATDAINTYKKKIAEKKSQKNSREKVLSRIDRMKRDI